MSGLDAVVVGAGPNGLAAAIDLARAGRSVRVYEAADRVGGGTRSAEITLPGFVHDVCASVHPLSLASPFLRSLDLARHGLEWVQPEAPVAHALAPGRSVVAGARLATVDEALGRDADAWRGLFGPLVREWERLVPMLLAPVIRPPRHPLLLARFGLPACSRPRTSSGSRSASPRRERCSRAWPPTRCSVSGSRSAAPSGSCWGCSRTRSAGRWPAAGAGRSPRRSRRRPARLGVEVVTGHRVDSLGDLPPARAYLLDVTPRQVLALAGDRLPDRLPPPARGVPLRARRVQDRLGARRPDPVDGPCDGASRDGPPRRHLSRGRRVRGRRRTRGGTRRSRSSSSSSRRSPIRHERRRASTSPGRTATSPTAPPWT